MIKSPREPRPVPVRRYRYSKWRWRVLVRILDHFGSTLWAAWRAVRPAPETPDPPRKILIVQLDHLGDAVLSSPLVDHLARAFPDAAIDVLASPSNREVFAIDPRIGRVHVATRNWFERGAQGRRAFLSAVWSLGRSLRAERYDLGIDVRGDVLSVFVLALARIPRRVGWAMGGGGFLLTDVAEWIPGRHEVESRLALLARMGLAVDHPVRVSVAVTDRDRVRVGRRLRHPKGVRRAAAFPPRVPAGRLPRPQRAAPAARDGDDGEGLASEPARSAERLLAIHPGAGTAAKRWPIHHWRSLIGRFLDDGWRVVVLGSSDDATAVSSLGSRDDLLNWAGATGVAEATALLERADLFIGVDSGPAHLAACAGIPSVILFSGTNRHRQWRPWSRRSLVLRHRVPCRPCHHKVCPLADHPCMVGIDPDRVYRAALRWWVRMHRESTSQLPRLQIRT